MKGHRYTVKVAGDQRERRFAPGTPKRVITAWKIHEKSKLLKRHSASAPRRTASGTIAADIEHQYLPMVRHLVAWKTRRAEIRHWVPFIGTQYRHTVTRADVLRARGTWVAAGVAAKTINNRITALRNFYRLLDGDTAPTPCDGVKQMTPPKVPPQMVTAETVNRVCNTLLARAQASEGHRSHAGRPSGLHALQDRARLMVMASTGKRPCEIARAVPADVNLERRVWLTRDAKGGFSPGAYLNDEMLARDAGGLAGVHRGRGLGTIPRPLRAPPEGCRLAGWGQTLQPPALDVDRSQRARVRPGGHPGRCRTQADEHHATALRPGAQFADAEVVRRVRRPVWVDSQKDASLNCAEGCRWHTR